MLETEIMNLDTLKVADLMQTWKYYFDNEPHTHNRLYLISRLAYKMQEALYGGISQKSNKILSENLSCYRFKCVRNRKLPPAGTKIIRTYNGKEYEIIVLEYGFEFNKKHYKSLSAIALELTGKKVSGFYFFGLKKENYQ